MSVRITKKKVKTTHRPKPVTLVTLSEAEIEVIRTEAFEEGREEGYAHGHDAGFEEGREEGLEEREND